MVPSSPELVRPHLDVPDPGVTGPRGKGVPTSKKHPQDALSQTTWPGKHLELCLGHRKPQQMPQQGHDVQAKDGDRARGADSQTQVSVPLQR